MQIRFIRLVDDLFKDVRDSRKTLELKEEMVQNLMEKYQDLLSEGRSEEAAFSIAAASIGDINELVAELRKDDPTYRPAPEPRRVEGPREPDVETAAPEAQAPDMTRYRSAVTTAIAIMFFILSPVPYLFSDSAIAGMLMFAMVASGVGLLVFNSMLKPRPQHNASIDPEPEMLAGANSCDAIDKTARKTSAKSSLSSAMWLLTVAVYVMISFRTGAWHLTWIIFPFASALDNVLKVLLIRDRGKATKLLSGALWSSTVGIYFLISFGSGAWHMTWIIFLVASALQNMLKALLSKQKEGR